MGLCYDSTADRTWMGAKVYVEYSIGLVNRFIESKKTTDIPAPILRTIERNVNRGVAQLSKDTLREPYWGSRINAMKPLYRKVFRESINTESGRCEGAVPAEELAEFFDHIRELFAISYAASRFEAKKEILIDCNPCNEQGMIDSWDSSRYDRPEDDPDAKVTSWEDFDEEVWDILVADGKHYWGVNESEIYADLWEAGPYTGHVDGYRHNRADVSVESDMRIRLPDEPSGIQEVEPETRKALHNPPPDMVLVAEMIKKSRPGENTDLME